MTLEYLFKLGQDRRVWDESVPRRRHGQQCSAVPGQPAGPPDFYQQTYLRVVDQAGVSATGPIFGKNYFEGNVGYLRSTSAGDRLGGTLRLIFPITT